MTEGVTKVWRSRGIQWMFSIPLTVISLALLMILTFWGTMYQVEHGLFAAQERFFTSWWVWMGGFFPFPGGKLVLAVLMVNLLGYMINMLAFQPLRPGIVLIHSGLLIMLIGGAVTHYYGEESYLSLWEGEASNVANSYYEWELAVWTRDGVVREVYAIDTRGLQAGDVLTFDPLPIRVAVEQYYGNARAYQNRSGETPFLSSFNISRIEEAPLMKEPSQNNAAGIFLVSAPDLAPQRVLLFADDTAPLIIPVDGQEYAIGLRHKRRPLPLLVKLLDFRKEVHPGTSMARSFSSLVEVHSEGGTRQLTISMNKPLRYHGYTLYQQSYREGPDGAESSTFAVTRNYGRLLPYVSTGMVVLGMLVHFTAMLMRHARRQTSRMAEGSAS